MIKPVGLVLLLGIAATQAVPERPLATAFAVTTGLADRASGAPVRAAIQVNSSDGRATGARRPLRVLYDIAAMVAR